MEGTRAHDMHGNSIDALREISGTTDAFEKNKSTTGDLRPLNLQKKLEIKKQCASSDCVTTRASGMQYNLPNEWNLHSRLERNIFSELQ